MARDEYRPVAVIVEGLDMLAIEAPETNTAMRNAFKVLHF